MDEVPNEGRKQGLRSIFVPLGLLQLKNPPPISSLTLLLLACVAGQSGARPTDYVRSILRISYGAGRGVGREGEWRKRSAEVGCRGGTGSKRDTW